MESKKWIRSPRLLQIREKRHFTLGEVNEIIAKNNKFEMNERKNDALLLKYTSQT